MPPVPKRHCGAILFDVNASNKEQGLEALLKISTWKWFSTTKDGYKFILFNTKKSRNSLGYHNIQETKIDWHPRRILNCVEEAEPAKGSWLDAMLVGIDFLKTHFQSPNIITLQLLVISNLDSSVNDTSKEKIKEIISCLKGYNIFLYIIGPNVKLPFTITCADDVAECMKEVVVDESNPALVIAKQIIQESENCVICDLKVGINLFFSYRNSPGSQPWKVPLSFGTHLEIPANTVKIYKIDPPFKLAKVQSGIPPKIVLVEDESVKVDPSDLVRGVQRHGKFVRMENNEMFKLNGPRCFDVIGFTSHKNIPEHYMRGEAGTYFVLPDEDQSEDACQALYLLVDILAEQKKYGIVRRVFNNNNKPKYFVLVAQPDLEPKCFVMSELPYADSVRDFYTCDEPTKTENDEKDLFTKFFNSLDIWSEDCKVKVPLAPTMKNEDYSVKLGNKAAEKLLEREFNFTELDLDLLEEAGPNEFFEALQEEWPVNSTKEEKGDVNEDEHMAE